MNTLVANAVRTAMRNSRRRMRRADAGVAIALSCTLIPVMTHAAELPVACVAGSCTRGGVPISFLSSGNASFVLSGNSLNITQTTQNAVLNWKSFNIGPDGTVNFDQPNSTAVALNRIFQGSPSEIFGSLKANGKVYLINQNGILFGAGARVNVGGLIASSLDVTPNALENGIAQSAKSGVAAFANGSGDPSGAVTVENGAKLEAASGGQVFLFAPEQVTNRGSISTPDGQTILAAGRSVYLATSGDENLRGFFVEVDADGTVTNGQAGGATGRAPQDVVGQIVADRGNVTLAGLAVNQLGRVSATTSVRSNGSIRLQARDTTIVTQVNGVPLLAAQRGGELTVGRDAINEVTLVQDDAQTQVDVNKQLQSSVLMDGAQVRLLENSRTTAIAGKVDIYARSNSQSSPSGGTFSEIPDDSKLYVASGATIDVSGANIELPMESNIVRVELRGSQVADSPQQRDGALRGQTVFVDIRRRGTREDGTTWQGTPLADVSADITAVGRAIGERSLTGGSVTLQSQGSVLVADSATVDLSGGSIRYLDGYVTTTQLLSAGRLYDIGDADPNRVYDGIGNTISVAHTKWGVTETFSTLGSGTTARMERGYLEGKDAGSLSIVAPWFAFDGKIDGSTVRGVHQRLPSTSLSAGQLYRAYDQIPLGAKLELGYADSSPTQNFILGDVRVSSGSVLSSLKNPDGTPFDPLQDSVPANHGETLLRSELLGAQSVARVGIYSNGKITFPEDVSVSLPAGGQLTAAGSTMVVDGMIAAPSGSIDLAARASIANPTDVSLLVGEKASLSAIGRWVNDNALLNAPGGILDELYISGGRINLAARQGELNTAAGSQIDVSGGAWLNAAGKLSAGTGGSVSLTTTPDNTVGQTAAEVPLILGAEIRGYSVGRGGKLSITASSIYVADTDNTQDDPNRLWIRPELLESSGFGSYSLSSNRGGLTVADGSEIQLRQRNLELSGPLSLRASADSILGFSSLTTLDSLLRASVDLSLSSSVTTGMDVTAAAFSQLPKLYVGTGSSILGDAGAKIALSANTTIDLNGTISAPAGSISVELNNSLPISQIPDAQGKQFPDSQGIWLRDQAQLLSQGAWRVKYDALGRRTGEVLDAGNISITAQRGYIVTLPSSAIDVSGVATDLDLRSTLTGAYEVRRVAGDAGSIALTAAEGMVLNGNLLGRAADASGARGGELSIVLDPSNRNDRGSPVSLFPQTPRTIVLSETTTPTIVAPGTNVPRMFNGMAAIGADSIEDGGFDGLRLAAHELEGRVTGPLELSARGVIRLDGEVDLDLKRNITLDASIIDGSGADARLSAQTVSIGASSRQYQSLPTSIPGGNGTLFVEAGLLDFYGNVALQGVGDAHFASSGDIRARGVQLINAQQLTGSLISGGNLRFTAEQLYPTTLSKFNIEARGAGHSIRVFGTGGTAAPVLSAGGQLTLKAETIDQQGALRAPFGSIALSGTHVLLGAGSITSTSGAGLSVPFGQTQGGFDWVYPLLDEQTLVFDGEDDELPQQRVALEGANVQVGSGAQIDLSGGGDLLAYEFEPGVNGTRDVLSNTLRPNQYAILPDLGLEYAPYDPSISAGSNLQVGERVWLDGTGDLKAGFYTLLPARYALLPGAYLVTAKSGFADILPGEQLRQLDGSTIVAGYRSTAGTDLRDSRYGGFAVRRGSEVAREARYTQIGATQFFSAQAEREGSATPRLPKDAGILSLNAQQQLTLDGSLLAARGENGRGAAVDISAGRLRIVSSQTAIPQNNEVVIQAAALNNLGAESLLLGATRTHGSEGVRLNVAAQNVTVDTGAELQAPELLIGAKERIDIKTGAVLAANGTQANTDEALLLQGDGALLRVSAGEQVRVERTGDTAIAGTLNLEEGSVVRARNGAVLMDATRDSVSRGQLDISGSSLNLAASRISLGQGAGVPSGLALNDVQLAALDLNELVLTSRSTLDLYGNVNLGVKDLTIHAGGIVSRSSGEAALVADRTLRLANPNGVLVPQAANASSSLLLAAQHVEFGAGDFAIAGVEATRISASGRVRALETGTTYVGGDLEIATPLITTGSGAARAIAATGVLSTVAMEPISIAQPNEVTEETQTAGIGGHLSLQGKSVLHGGNIEMPAGEIRLEATGSAAGDDVTLAAGSSISLRGMKRAFDGVDIFVSGGDASLIARSGRVVGNTGSLLDVSGDAAGGDAGRVTVQATNGDAVLSGSILGGAATGYEGGAVSIDAANITQFDTLAHALSGAGFSRELAFRLRGAGDLSLSGAPLISSAIGLTADQGSIHMLGGLDARGPSGGSIELSARDDIRIAGALSAAATHAGGRGGQVLLSSSEGGVQLESAGSIDVSAGAAIGTEAVRHGEVTVRVSQEAVQSILDGDAANNALVLQGQVTGAGRYWLEGFKSYESLDGIIDFDDVMPSTSNPIYADAAAFMANSGAIAAALGLSGNAAFKVVPGVEIRSSGDLTLAADWNLYDWHFANDAPGMLTLRAAGDLIFDRSLSDGFAYLPDPNNFDPDASVLAFTLAKPRRESWSYRLVGGADLSAASSLATLLSSGLTNNRGNVRISAGTCCTIVDPFNPPDYRMVRTGTGDIAVRAARDFILGNLDNPSALDQTAMLYTAGVAGPGITLPGDFGGLNSLPYPIDGGDISIRAGNSVRGAVSNQLVSDWLWRVGGAGSSTAWTVNYRSFMQGVGALGGGNIDVIAGRDVENISLSLPAIGRQVGGLSSASNAVEVVGAGTLNLRAGGSILGGTYLLGNGFARLQAGQNIGAPAVSQVFAQPAMSPLLGFSGSGRYDLDARHDLSIESAFNATLIPQGYSQQVFNDRAYFSTYTDESAIDLTSATGAVTLKNNTHVAEQLFISSAPLTGVDSASLLAYPGTLRAAAFDGDISIPRSMFMFPASKGNLELFADDSIAFGRQDAAMVLTLSDAGAATLPSVLHPLGDLSLLDTLIKSPSDVRHHGSIPVHSLEAQEDGVADTAPVRVVARSGDIFMDVNQQAGVTGIYLSKHARFTAGGNIKDLTLLAQHTSPQDITSVSAGKDITYSMGRNSFGILQQNSGSLIVDGPGRLELTAGRNLDLQTSSGIVTRGNLFNPALSNEGATVSVLAGMRERQPDYAAFAERYLQTGTDYDADLLAYVSSMSGESIADKAQALNIFGSLPVSARRNFLEKVLFTELRSSGRAAARDANADFSRGFTALEILFPGVNPADDGAQTNPNAGDINLYFSRIYTLDGGSIDLLAPGGQVNAGLATPPQSFGIRKAASELGVVAQSSGDVSALVYDDFAVNESRVFAADGGNILVWSMQGDIDAGRGAKTAISAPAPVISFDANGNVQVNFPAALTGSGIQTLATTAGRDPGDVDLFAPRGVVNAGDAGIVAGNLTIAATAVLGADNIKVSGVSVGVPVDAGGLGASLSGVSSVASSAASAAAMAVDTDASKDDQKAPLADAALTWLDVFVIGLGEENCKQDDLECLKRQRLKAAEREKGTQQQSPAAPSTKNN